MSWKESKVRLLPPMPPQAVNPQELKGDRKPDIQDLFLLASQATALRNSNPLSTVTASEHAASTTVSVTGSNPDLSRLHLQAGHTQHLHQQQTSMCYPGTSIKIEPVILPSSSSNLSNVPLDSAMMPPPPPPLPRPPASPGVSSTSGDSDFLSDNTAHCSPQSIPNNSPIQTANQNNCPMTAHQMGMVPPQSLGKKNDNKKSNNTYFQEFIRSMCYSLEACCPTETLLKTGRTRLLLSGDVTVRASPSQARTVCWGCRHMPACPVCWLPPRARAHVANDLRARKACCPVMHGRLLLLSSPVKQQARCAAHTAAGAVAGQQSVGWSLG